MGKIDDSVFIAEGVRLVGDITIGRGSSIWFNSVIRADENEVRIGEESNVQDCCVFHTGTRYPVIIGDRVTIGHSAVIHGCTIGDGTLIGMGSILMNGSVIGEGSVIGAGSLVTQNTVIPPGSLAYGSPAKVIRPVTEEERKRNLWAADEYVGLVREMKSKTKD